MLFNTRKHDDPSRAGAQPRSVDRRDALDAFSSAPWFEAWAPEARPPPDILAYARRHWPERAPITPPQTWLATTGWRRAGGAVRFDEAPRARR